MAEKYPYNAYEYLGALMFMTGGARGELYQTVNQCQCLVNNMSMQAWAAAWRCGNYACSTWENGYVYWRYEKDWYNMRIFISADASHPGLEELLGVFRTDGAKTKGLSRGGGTVSIAHGTVVVWSGLIRRVCPSTTSAETAMLHKAASVNRWVLKFCSYLVDTETTWTSLPLPTMMGST